LSQHEIHHGVNIIKEISFLSALADIGDQSLSVKTLI